jgi:exonuclease III
VRIATFNINNVNRRLPNLLRWLAASSPDVVCLQELKCTDGDFRALFGLFCYSTFELPNMALLKHWEWVVVVRHRLGRCPHGDLRIRRRCCLRLENGQALVQ